MKYREFSKKIDWEISALSFGCMRLPTRKKFLFKKEVDEKEAIRIIRHGIDNGVNFVDTAYGYHSRKSEIILGKALKDGYREKVWLETKCPMGKVKETGDVEKLLHEQLKKLDVDYLDIYLFHGLNRDRFDNQVIKLKLLDEMEKLRDQGLIKHIGFSFHDNYSALRHIIDGYDGWDSILMQYNYLGEYKQGTGEGVKYAHNAGLGVVIMGPVGGGRLAKPDKDMLAVMDGALNKRKPADWALQYVWNRPEVSSALSGMSSYEQVLENLESAEHSEPGKLSENDKQILENITEQFRNKIFTPCTYCDYCVEDDGCPEGVNIPKNFSIANNLKMNSGEKNQNRQREEYKKLVDAGISASSCTECRTCVPKCPQSIDIPEDLKKVIEMLNVSE